MRHFFRFTIRDLLWLTLVVAVGMGWFAHNKYRDERQRSEMKKLATICAEVQREGWGQVNAVENAIGQRGYVVFWKGDMTGFLLRSPDGTETTHDVVDFDRPNRTSK